MKRHKLSRSFSKKAFARGAERVHKKNAPSSTFIMRGGIRL